jgi:aconitate hydratase
VPFRLTRAILEAHGLAAACPGDGRDALLPRVDQVLLGRDHAPLAVALLERAGSGPARVRTVLAATSPRDGGEVPAGADWRRLALARGMLLPRPGHGAPETLHRERLAAPGRLALCAGPLPACGAFGMLALSADVLEATAVLAGGDFALREPAGLGVALEGRLPAGVGGADVALAVLARLREAGAAADVVEFGGDGAAALPMAERVSAAWLLAQGGLPSLFPADETTRVALAALGREPDWRRLEAVAGDGDLRLDLGSLEPLLAPANPGVRGGVDPAAVRPVRADAGTAVGRVVVGPAAMPEDLARLADCLRGRRVAEGVECVVVAGSRRLLDLAVAAGVAARLAEAGVRVVEGEPPAAALRAGAGAAGTGTGLCFGVPFEWVAEGRGGWLAGGIETLAAAAASGTVLVPPGCAEPAPLEIAGALAAEPWLPAPAAADAPAPPARPRAAARPFRWRGEVLIELGDEVETATLLAPGARLDEARGRLRAMAGALLAGIEPGFAERARRQGGGWVVAGSGFLRGASRETAAACMAEAGVWGILARSYAPGAARALAHAGVVPFTVTGGRPRRGDELEVAGLPEALRPGHPVAARDLTRGTHLGLAHELSAREVEVVRAGGLVAYAARSRPRGEEE